MQLRLALAAALTASYMATACASCRLGAVNVQGNSATSGETTLHLGEADDQQHPTAWQGPLTISSASRSCAVDAAVSIIKQPLLAGSGVVYVPTYSGSENRLYAVDLKTCQVVWKSPVYTGKVSYGDGRLTMGEQALALTPQCRPQSSRPRTP